MKIPVFHITHLGNLEGIIKKWALYSDTCINHLDIEVNNFSNHELKYERAHFSVPLCEGGVLADYVPFFFTNRPPMLYSIKYKHGKEVQRKYIHLISSIDVIQKKGLRFCFTDGHAIMEYTSYSDDLDSIGNFIDWEMIQNPYWADTQADGDRKRRKQAEFM